MHPHRAVPLTVLGLLALATPAWSCTLNIPGGNGHLGTVQGNATQIGSQLGTGTSATLTTLLPLLSGVTIDVGAPVLVDSPPGYSSAPAPPRSPTTPR